MFSRSCLLIFLIYGLHGLISRHVGLLMKFSLWSLRVTKHSLSAVVLIRSAKSSCFAMFTSVLVVSAIVALSILQ